MAGNIIPDSRLIGELTPVGNLTGVLSGYGFIEGNLALGKRDISTYNGPYTVTPLAGDEVILETEDKLLLENVTVLEIPYAEVSNLQGGYTVTIGG